MTWWRARMETAPKLVRVQEKGQVTLPTEIRRRLGLKKGDLVAVVATDGGILITPQEVVAVAALERIGEQLRTHRMSLDDFTAATHGLEDIAWERVRQVQDRNAGNDPDEVLADVSAEVESVRREQHERERQAKRRR
jgi:AbrB family looped-hinge helix DNA binding protein